MRSDKILAIRLRKQGYSYNKISDTLGIPKSTLSGWFRGLDISKIIKERNLSKSRAVWAQNITRFNKQRSIQIRKDWVTLQQKSKKEVGSLTRRELLLVGTSLYWAEGYKKTNWSLVFCNSDPKMVSLMVRFFTLICCVPKEKLKAQVQIYANIPLQKATRFWSGVSGIPKNQFTKPIYQISRASKLKRGNTLPNGTFRLKVNDVNIVNKIKGWIEGLAGNLFTR